MFSKGSHHYVLYAYGNSGNIMFIKVDDQSHSIIIVVWPIVDRRSYRKMWPILSSGRSILVEVTKHDSIEFSNLNKYEYIALR